jgi:hypothetical protein
MFLPPLQNAGWTHNKKTSFENIAAIGYLETTVTNQYRVFKKEL